MSARVRLRVKAQLWSERERTPSRESQATLTPFAHRRAIRHTHARSLTHSHAALTDVVDCRFPAATAAAAASAKRDEVQAERQELVITLLQPTLSLSLSLALSLILAQN